MAYNRTEGPIAQQQILQPNIVDDTVYSPFAGDPDEEPVLAREVDVALVEHAQCTRVPEQALDRRTLLWEGVAGRSETPTIEPLQDAIAVLVECSDDFPTTAERFSLV